MANNTRPIRSGKRARSRRKRVALRTANGANKSPTSECDSDEDAKRLLLTESGGDPSSSDKTTSQSEDGLVLVCRPTMPDFCSVFVPRGEEPPFSRSRKAADCNTFTVHISSFQETCEGFVTYTLRLTTCDQPYHTFQLERRYSEFAACAAEVNKQLVSGFAARCCARHEERKAAALKDVDEFQWELPAKTWFRVTQTNALEERRAQLERSLETLLRQQDRRMCNLPVVRDFLMLDLFGLQVAERKDLEAATH